MYIVFCTSRSLLLTNSRILLPSVSLTQNPWLPLKQEEGIFTSSYILTDVLTVELHQVGMY